MDDVTKSLLLDMRKLCAEAVRLRANKPGKEIFDDRYAELAALHLIQTIGECAIRLDKSSKDWRNLLSDIPWQSIISMRHKIVHAYDDIQGLILADVLDKGIPQLESALDKLLGIEK